MSDEQNEDPGIQTPMHEALQASRGFDMMQVPNDVSAAAANLQVIEDNPVAAIEIRSPNNTRRIGWSMQARGIPYGHQIPPNVNPLAAPVRHALKRAFQVIGPGGEQVDFHLLWDSGGSDVFVVWDCDTEGRYEFHCSFRGSANQPWATACKGWDVPGNGGGSSCQG